MSPPNKNPAPRGLMLHPLISSGSLHIKSHIAPSWGTSYFLSIDLISSRVSKDGDSPPCTQKIRSSIIAARGKKSKISVQNLQTLTDPYFLRHSS
jgi:hypothetical protein